MSKVAIVERDEENKLTRLSPGLFESLKLRSEVEGFVLGAEDMFPLFGSFLKFYMVDEYPTAREWIDFVIKDSSCEDYLQDEKKNGLPAKEKNVVDASVMALCLYALANENAWVDLDTHMEHVVILRIMFHQATLAQMGFLKVTCDYAWNNLLQEEHTIEITDKSIEYGKQMGWDCNFQ